jgi:hypothetical protein
MYQDTEEMRSTEVVVSTKKWLVAPRISRTIPFGYKVDPDDDDLLLPVPLELEALERAKRHLNNYSYRDVSKWLEEVTGRYISHIGLRKRVENDRKSRNALKGYKLQAARLAQIIAKAEKAHSINNPED